MRWGWWHVITPMSWRKMEGIYKIHEIHLSPTWFCLKMGNRENDALKFKPWDLGVPNFETSPSFTPPLRGNGKKLMVLPELTRKIHSQAVRSVDEEPDRFPSQALLDSHAVAPTSAEATAAHVALQPGSGPLPAGGAAVAKVAKVSSMAMDCRDVSNPDSPAGTAAFGHRSRNDSNFSRTHSFPSNP